MMSGPGYRDERETLRARVSALEAALEAAEHGPERIEMLLREKQIKDLTKKVQKLMAENESLRDEASKLRLPKCPWPAVVTFVLSAIAIVVQGHC